MLLFQYLTKMLKKQHLRFLEINEIFLWCETPKLVLMKENVLFFVLFNNKERKTTKTVFSFFVLFNKVKKNKK